MKRILCSRQGKMGLSCLLGITNFDPAHEKHCVERTYKFRKFCIMSVMKSQKAAENSQNKEKQTTIVGSLCYKHSWPLSNLEIIKSFLILIEAKSLCYTIHLSLTKSVRSRWLDISLVLSLRYGPQLYLGL